MSDILSQRAFERTSTYERLFRPAGMRYQMTIVTRGPIGKRGRSWVLNRDDRDFSDAELDTAKRLQPLLILLDDAARRLDDRALLPADRCVASADRLRLSRRELEVLRLLARGCKAQQIARLLEISPRTVRKHLENTYAKLGCSDRLLAVERARRAGLLD
jgi:DNA-binding CsgD family transcriptional regulator